MNAEDYPQVDMDTVRAYTNSVRIDADTAVNFDTYGNDSITNTCLSLGQFLREKNRRYGNSVGDPLKIFSQEDSSSGILVRLDDKLSRIKNSDELRKNDVVDLLGYLVLLCVSHDWTDFTDLID